MWSVDFHKDGYLATAGADKEVKLWRVEEDADGAPTVKHLESLTGSHNRGINVVRFAPSGDVLASGVRRPDPSSVGGRCRRSSGSQSPHAHALWDGPLLMVRERVTWVRADWGVVTGWQADGGELILWKPTGLARPVSLKADEVVENCSWKATRTLVAHNDDVQDVSWAPHSDMLMSGSVDNSCIVWDSLKCAPPRHLLGLASQTSALVWMGLGMNQQCEARSLYYPRMFHGPRSVSFFSTVASGLGMVCALGHGAHSVWLRCGCGCDGSAGVFPGKAMMRVADHKHYVQGVAWDPAGEFLVSQSGDRTCRVYSAVLPQKANGKTPTNVEWVKFLHCSVRVKCAPPPLFSRDSRQARDRCSAVRSIFRLAKGSEEGRGDGISLRTRSRRISRS